MRSRIPLNRADRHLALRAGGPDSCGSRIDTTPGYGPVCGRIPDVTSQRDSASQQAQDDLDELLNASLPFAQQMLDKHGEFYPYAVTITASGETLLVAGEPGQGEHPNNADILQVLVEGLRARRDALRAAAMVSDVRLSDSDAVRVEVEHEEGPAIAAFLPYGKKRPRRGIEYGEMTADSGDRKVWT
jgi:hypothetical protein